MSRTAACVISLVLGLPILAMVAVAAAGGFDPSLLTTFLVCGVVMTFVVGAIFEIKRLLDSDERDTAHAQAGHGGAHTVSVVDAPVARAPEVGTVPVRESLVAEQSVEAAEVIAARPEPIIVESGPRLEPPKVEPPKVEPAKVEAAPVEARPIVAKRPAKSGRAKRVSVSDAAPEQSVAAAKPKRKGSRSKQPTPV